MATWSFFIETRSVWWWKVQKARLDRCWTPTVVFTTSTQTPTGSSAQDLLSSLTFHSWDGVQGAQRPLFPNWTEGAQQLWRKWWDGHLLMEHWITSFWPQDWIQLRHLSMLSEWTGIHSLKPSMCKWDAWHPVTLNAFPISECSWGCFIKYKNPSTTSDQLNKNIWEVVPKCHCFKSLPHYSNWTTISSNSMWIVTSASERVRRLAMLCLPFSSF